MSTENGNTDNGLKGFTGFTEDEKEWIHDLSNELIVIGDISSDQLIRVNPSFKRILGYEEEEILNRSILELIHEKDHTTVRSHLEQLRNGKGVQGVEFRVRHSSGEYIWTQWNGKPAPESGKYFAIGRDITPEFHLREILQENQQKYFTLFEDSPLALMVHDGRRIQEVNEKMVELLKAPSKADLFKIGPSDVVPEEIRGMVQDRIDKVITEQRSSGIREMKFLKWSGDSIDVSVEGKPVWYRGRKCVLTVVQDISDRKEAEERLKNREAEYRSVVEGTSDLLFTLMPLSVDKGKYKVKFVNQSYLDQTGFKKEELVEKMPEEILPPEHAEKVKGKFEEAIRKGKTLEYDEWLEVKGKSKVFSTRLSPVFNDDGDCIQLIGVSRDMTKDREREEELRKLSRIVKEIKNGIIISDIDGNIEWANEGFTKITGYGSEEVIGRSPGEVLQGEGTSREAIEKMRKARVEEKSVDVELLNYKKDGTPIWIEMLLHPVFDENGELQNYIGIQIDISQRKEAEKKLKESEARFRQLVENLNEGIFQVDKDLRICYINRSLLETMGWNQEELMGAHILEAVSEKDPDNFSKLSSIMDDRKDGKSSQNEIHVKDEDGKDHPFLVSGSPLFLEDGTFNGSIAILTDLSERKETEKEVLNAVIQTQERERKRFSHELHEGVAQQLSAIRMNLDSVKGNDRDKELLGQIRELASQAIDSIRLISNDLMPHELRDFGLNSAISNYLASIQKSTGVQIDLDPLKGSERFAENVEVVAYRTIQEIVSNSVKYGDISHIHVELDDGMSGWEIITRISIRGRVTKADSGIFELERRVRYLGGALNVKEPEDRFLIVETRIPVDKVPDVGMDPNHS